jgi:hypothetical protein
VKEVFTWWINVVCMIYKLQSKRTKWRFSHGSFLWSICARFLTSRSWLPFSIHGKVILFRGSQGAIKRHLMRFFCLLASAAWWGAVASEKMHLFWSQACWLWFKIIQRFTGEIRPDAMWPTGRSSTQTNVERKGAKGSWNHIGFKFLRFWRSITSYITKGSKGCKMEQL